MRAAAGILINTARIEIWPGGLLRARGNRDARLLARARHVLRRKCDGRYLAVDLAEGLRPLLPSLRHEPGMRDALAALERVHARRRPGIDVVASLPLRRLRERLDALG